VVDKRTYLYRFCCEVEQQIPVDAQVQVVTAVESASGEVFDHDRDLGRLECTLRHSLGDTVPEASLSFDSSHLLAMLARRIQSLVDHPDGFFWERGLALENSRVFGIDLKTRKRTLLAGPSKHTTGYRDGAAGQALFSGIQGLAVDAAGALFVADGGNHVVRKLSRTGALWQVSTLAGTRNKHACVTQPEKTGEVLFTDLRAVEASGGAVYAVDHECGIKQFLSAQAALLPKGGKQDHRGDDRDHPSMYQEAATTPRDEARAPGYGADLGPR